MKRHVMNRRLSSGPHGRQNPSRGRVLALVFCIILADPGKDLSYQHDQHQGHMHGPHTSCFPWYVSSGGLLRRTGTPCAWRRVCRVICPVKLQGLRRRKFWGNGAAAREHGKLVSQKEIKVARVRDTYLGANLQGPREELLNQIGNNRNRASVVRRRNAIGCL